MAFANKHHLLFSKPLTKPPLLPSLNPKNPSTSSDTETDKNLTFPTIKSEPSINTPLSIDGTEEDSVLSRSEFLTREEVLRRRSRRVKQLAKYYKNQYWALMDEVRVKYREYYWKYGKSPFKDDEEERQKKEREGGGENEGGRENGRLGLGLGFGGENNGNKRCGFGGCKTKAMALTNYCHLHILSDSKQKLYKACSYVIKSTQTGPVICGKPVLRAAVPSLCTVHFQKAQKHVSQALKRAGLNIPSSSKSAPKFHVIISEYVRQIQAKRREARRAIVEHVVIKGENVI
ncbi:uncharacterized protein LOC143862213 [Tasmannia lanceolata]|uniref:uncharacterized protein LOC143862213 n=1 Tax=Tasmannia lanceolata TaxID=3420 RepID=UPI00406318A9